ncbi:acyl carrier protein [Rhodococcus sp. 1168]|uniref:acyl carrier protein n=1 Tax=Rhodococcus sp. 1168 TaxID=2018041 RepID=UPI000A0C85E1|nr:acyl carrier protein [Rhodococcus sp. 1168]ORI17278.1 hypothetical protein BJI47_13625 [Rhodococcus sp. 1168]
MTESTAVHVDEIQNHIVDQLVTKYQVAESDAVPSAVLDDLDIDSMTLMEIALAIEKRFSLSVPDGVLEPAQTIDAAARAVLTHGQQ